MNLSIVIISSLLLGFNSSDDVVWHWYSHCLKADTMYAEVLFHNKSIYKTFFPICAMHRSEIKPDRSQKILEFYFTADCRIFKTGEDSNLDSLFESFGTKRIEGNIWEAGRDPKDILLGVSCVIKEQILLNGIHIAKIRETSTTRLADGLIISTYFKK